MAAVKSESELEQSFIKRLVKMGYQHAELSNYEDVVSNFRKQFCKLNAKALIKANKEASLSESEFAKVMLRLDNHTVYDSAKILREEWVLELDNGKSIYVNFLTNDIDRNTYQVAHQITMDKAHLDDVEYENRYDVTVLVNGLPLIQIELKRSGIEINEAINQIDRYRRFSFKRLFRYLQIFVVSNSVQTKFFANINERDPFGNEQRILKSLVFYWTDINNVRKVTLGDFTRDFFDKFSITEMLTKFMVVKESEPILMVMRPYQIYAVKEAMSRIFDSDFSGYVFHTTGSGKTLTSFKLASLLRDHPKVEKVFFLIDRKDLDDQTVDEYNSFEKGCVDTTESTFNLVNDLKDTSKRLIITTIQKMANAIKNKRYAKIMARFVNEKCVFIIDECHRSQFGKMHNEIKRHFQNANYIGFTGTPIFAENRAGNNRTTADIFYSGTLDSCIHRYMIKDAIADGNVLRFSVEYMRSINPRSVSIAGFDINKADDPDYCRSMGIDLEALYHDPLRIEMIADNILENLDKHIMPAGRDVYTALFAVDKIQTLMDYYHAFKAKNKNGYRICAIFTCQLNDDLDEGQDEHSIENLKECMDDYNALFGTSYDPTTFDAYRKDIVKRLKQKDLPQVDLLLVVNMFLTGFDSKATNTLFLDKHLVWHSLMQAYSRTNRVDKVTKQFGQIVTYRNIKKAQDDALRLFSGRGNPNDYLLENYEYYLAQYRDEVKAIHAVCKTPDDCKNLVSENNKKRFILVFRELQKVLSTLKTFSKFNWDDLDIFMDEDEYTQYKTWYLELYDEQKSENKKGDKNGLTDVDFNIELIRTDKINVVYVLNLLKEVDRSSEEEMQKGVDDILLQIDRSDNEKLRCKRDIMKGFISELFAMISSGNTSKKPAKQSVSHARKQSINLDIPREYAKYEKEVLKKEIATFCKKYDLKIPLITSLLNEYFEDEMSISKDKIRQRLAYKNLKLSELRDLIDTIYKFIKDKYDKFTPEGV